MKVGNEEHVQVVMTLRGHQGSSFSLAFIQDGHPAAIESGFPNTLINKPHQFSRQTPTM